MNLRGAMTAFAGGVGLVIGVVGVAVISAVTLVALGIPADSRADDAPAPAVTPAAPLPAELVVALSFSDPALQAGVVRGRDVVLARGLEVELARNIGERLGIKSIRFVAVRPASRLLSDLLSRRADWDLALSFESPRSTSPVAQLTAPYLATDQAVLLRRSTARPRSLAELRTRQLCAVAGTNGARTIASLAPEAPALKVAGTARLLQLIQTGACDAAVVDAIKAGRITEGHRALVGPFAARIAHGSGLVVGVSRTSTVPATAVDRIVKRLRANGTLSRLARFWLGVDPAALPVLS